MRAVATGVLFALATIAVPRASDWEAVVKQVGQSIMYLEGGEGACTAFVIDAKRHYAMTAAHCYQKDIWVDRVKATPVALDTKKDLLVLEIKEMDPSRPALKLAAKNPAIGAEVMSAGFGYALERPFFRQAHIQDDALMIPENGVGGPFISTDTSFVGGQSGGPVVNSACEVVMIVQRGDAGTTGLGVGAEIIRERMGRFFGGAQ